MIYLKSNISSKEHQESVPFIKRFVCAFLHHRMVFKTHRWKETNLKGSDNVGLTRLKNKEHTASISSGAGLFTDMFADEHQRKQAISA
jgi:hypothetical protein